MSNPDISIEDKHEPMIRLAPSWGPPNIQNEPPRPNLLALIHKSFVEDVDPEWHQLNEVVGTLWPAQRSRLMRHAPSQHADQSWLKSLENLPRGHKDPLYKFDSLRDMCVAFLESNRYQSEASVAMLGTRSTSITFFFVSILQF